MFTMLMEQIKAFQNLPIGGESDAGSQQHEKGKWPIPSKKQARAKGKGIESDQVHTICPPPNGGGRWGGACLFLEGGGSGGGRDHPNNHHCWCATSHKTNTQRDRPHHVAASDSFFFSAAQPRLCLCLALCCSARLAQEGLRCHSKV